MSLNCGWCNFGVNAGGLSLVVEHLKQEHGDREIKYKRQLLDSDTGKLSWHSYVVPLVPSILRMEGKLVHFDIQTERFTIIQDHLTPGKSPAHKQLRLDGCGKDRIFKKSLFTDADNESPTLGDSIECSNTCEEIGDSGTVSGACSSGNTEQHIESSDNLEDKLHEIFPQVLRELKLKGQLEAWEKMMTLIKDGEFPFENISYLLFLDVVQFLSLPNTSLMRYSETVKRFWTTGFKLFHGKFVHFLSGRKHV